MSHATTTTAHPTFPPIVCTPWCDDNLGHPGDHADDQRCEHSVGEITRTLVPQWPAADGSYYPHVVEVQVLSGPHWPAMVLIYEAGDDVELRFSPAEARALIGHLTDALAMLAEESPAN